MRKTEYQIVLRKGDDIKICYSLSEAQKIFRSCSDATELRKVVWKKVRPKPTYYCPNPSVELYREEIVLNEKE